MSLARTPFGSDSSQIERLEYDGSNNPIYHGYAAPNTAESDPLWLIWKYTWSGGNMVAKNVADGKLDYGSVWNDRASYSYS